MTGFFPPYNRACLMCEARKVVWIIPSCGIPLTLGLALMHQQLHSLSQDTGQPERFF